MIQTSAKKFGKDRSLRFRRWSRKAYAAFVSRHSEVTIGQLSGNVCERLRCKTESNPPSLANVPCCKQNNDNEEPEDNLLNLGLSTLSSFFVSHYIAVSSTCCDASCAESIVAYLNLSYKKELGVLRHQAPFYLTIKQRDRAC